MYLLLQPHVPLVESCLLQELSALKKHMFPLTIFLVSSPTRVLLSIYRPQSCRSTPGPENKACCDDAIAHPDWVLCFYVQYAASILLECGHVIKSFPPLPPFFHHCRLRSLVKSLSRPKCSLVLWQTTYALTFCKLFLCKHLFFSECDFKKCRYANAMLHHIAETESDVTLT